MENVNLSLQFLIDDLYKEIRELLSSRMNDSFDDTVVGFLDDRDDLSFYLGKCDAFRTAWADIQDLLNDRKKRLVDDADGFETLP